MSVRFCFDATVPSEEINLDPTNFSDSNFVDFVHKGVIYKLNNIKLHVASYGLITFPDSDSGLRFQTQWLHCTVQNMFTLHKPRTRVPISYFCIIQESESEYVHVSESGNAIKPLQLPKLHKKGCTFAECQVCF